MDRPNDMLHYLQTGLERQGYNGCLAWRDVDRYKNAPPADETWDIDPETGSARAMMWGKDGAFWVTVEDANL